MSEAVKNIERLRFTVSLVQKEITHLEKTVTRLFAEPLAIDRVAKLSENDELAERVDAFVARFSRLQDTTGEQLIPFVLERLGEQRGAMIDMLSRAEQLGYLVSAEDWLKLRKLRNQMVHEYIDDPALLCDALNAGHKGVELLVATARRFIAEINDRQWL